MPRQPEPYPDDASYLEAELAWIEARCRRIEAQRAAANSVTDFPFSNNQTREPNRLRLFAWQQTKIEACAAEKHHRQEIEGRLKRTGKGPSLNALCQHFDLGPHERTTLLLAAASAISRAFEPVFAKLADFECDGVLCPGVVFDFLELSNADRVRGRALFAPQARLIRHQLLRFDAAATDHAFIDTPIRIRARALGTLLGTHPIA